VREGKVLQRVLRDRGITPSDFGAEYRTKYKTKTGYHHVKKWMDGYFFSESNQARAAEILGVDPSVFSGREPMTKQRATGGPKSKMLAAFLDGRDDVLPHERDVLLHLESLLSGEASPDFWPLQLMVLRNYHADRAERRGK
jgi:glycine cleavage system aminomethyltransferase T